MSYGFKFNNKKSVLKGHKSLDYYKKETDRKNNFYSTGVMYSNIKQKNHAKLHFSKKKPHVDKALMAKSISKSDIPSSFDARDKWKGIVGLPNDVYNQYQCGTCYIFSATEVIQDRINISLGKYAVPQLSEKYVLDCIPKISGKVDPKTCHAPSYYKGTKSDWDQLLCGDIANKCDGGNPETVFDWIGGTYDGTIHAIPEEENYDSYGQCSPNNGCKDQCGKATGSLWHAKGGYPVTNANEYLEDQISSIQREIMTKGPVSAGYVVYNDFMTWYPSSASSDGIFEPADISKSNISGGHAIEIMGWGNDNGTNYWLIKNSWGQGGGINGSGYFKLKMGTCEIENYVYGVDIDSKESKNIHDANNNNQPIPKPKRKRHPIYSNNIFDKIKYKIENNNLYMILFLLILMTIIYFGYEYYNKKY